MTHNREQKYLWECNDCRNRWLLAVNAPFENCPACGSTNTEAADPGEL